MLDFVGILRVLRKPHSHSWTWVNRVRPREEKGLA